MSTDLPLPSEELRVIEHVRDIKGFYSHVTTYVLVMALLFVINLVTDPSNIWAWWPALGWGLGVTMHGVNVFEVLNFFGPDWEKREIEKRLGRQLQDPPANREGPAREI